MKLLYNFRFLALVLFSLTSVTSCMNKLDLYPETQLSDAAYWKNADDIKNACNYMYPFLPDILTNLSYANYADDGVNSGAANQISDGSRLAPGSDADWNSNYSLIRVCNNILEKSAGIPGADAARYRGEARFFRAWANFELVKRFGDIPLILRTFDVTDSLNNAHRTNRAIVFDAIYADLDSAAAVLPAPDVLAAADYGRITSGAALALKARAALFEGTRIKFHGQGNATEHLNKAVAACETMMNSGKYDLYKYAADPALSYFNLFQYAGEGKANKENILVRLYGASATNKISTHRIQAMEQMGSSTPTRALADAYRYIDGLPIGKSPFTKPQTTTLTQFQNRDPRMDVTIFNKTHTFLGGLYVPEFGFTRSGYIYRKYFNYSPDYQQDFSFLDNIIIRYAEVLLTYAEAKYEINGSISDADLNKSVNLVRARANMPSLTNSFVTSNGLNMRTEIRTERRIELAMEGGHRYWDLIRWKEAEIELPKPTLGTKLLTAEYQHITSSIVIDADSFVVVQDASKRSFKPERDYLWPLPTRDLGLNLSLTQNPNW